MTTTLKTRSWNHLMYELGDGEGEIFKSCLDVPVEVGDVTLVAGGGYSIEFVNLVVQEDLRVGIIGRMFVSQYESLDVVLNRFNELRGFVPGVFEKRQSDRAKQLETIIRLSTQSVEGIIEGGLRLNGIRLFGWDKGIGSCGRFSFKTWNGIWGGGCIFTPVAFEGYLGRVEIISSRKYIRDGVNKTDVQVRFWYAQAEEVEAALIEQVLPTELVELYPGRTDGGIFRV